MEGRQDRLWGWPIFRFLKIWRQASLSYRQRLRVNGSRVYPQIIFDTLLFLSEKVLTVQFQEKDYQDYSALFIYSEHFSAVARTEYRIYLQELAQKIPIVFVGAQSLLYSDFDYEERNMEPRTQSYLQVLFYFSNGEDCLFRTDGFAYEEQRELAQAIRLLQEATSYTEWERAFYEY